MSLINNEDEIFNLILNTVQIESLLSENNYQVKFIIINNIYIYILILNLIFFNYRIQVMQILFNLKQIFQIYLNYLFLNLNHNKFFLQLLFLDYVHVQLINFLT